MRVVCVIQARMGSTRLPGKVLADLCGKPMLTHIVERVSRATKLDTVVVAVPGKAENVPLLELTQSCRVGTFYYLGDENDLVDRYLAAATAFDAEIIVRVCADNPCIDPAYIDHAVNVYLSSCKPFVTNTTALVYPSLECGPQSVDGIGAEVFSLSRLKWLDQMTQGRADWREHPHKWFYDLDVVYPHLPMPHLADVRLDVNTQADLDFIRDIYEHVYPAHPQFTVADVLAYLQNKQVI